MSTNNNIIKIPLQTLWLMLAWVTSSTQAGQSWSLSTSMTFNEGTYIYDNTIENYNLNVGVSYKKPLWSVTATLPLLAQQDNVGLTTSLEPGNAGDSLSLDMDSAHDNNVTMGFGDLYLYGQRTIWKNLKSRAFLSTTFQLKVPMVFSSEMFSSQKMDYGAGLTFRKYLGTYSLFTDLGYLVLGDPVWGKYKDPIIFGVGIGKTFLWKNVFASVYYRTYTEILAGISPPKQISMGIYARLTHQMYLSSNWTIGLSESSPDNGFSLGLNWNL